ncbi:hypothetical protein ANCCAN_01700 [Ancylostoma caninum]|uniref:SCP domain-containing protein n=1 Tax=Ancylostoma caninum TaxID=29170 RepID=A0A368HAC5_ANCCA|nr:hypothetical protein ANCCAN_01700 [Ancylostoma caninum]
MVLRFIYKKIFCNEGRSIKFWHEHNSRQKPPPAAADVTAQGSTICQNNEMTDAARKRVRAMHNWRRSQLALGNVKNGLNPYNCPPAANMYKMVIILD